MVVGTGGLVLFDGTPLIKDMNEGKWTQLTEREMMEELLLFIENLTCDCRFITHHTISANLNTDRFLDKKQFIINTLKDELESADFELLEKIRNSKKSL